MELKSKRRELKKLQQERDKRKSRKILQLEDLELREQAEQEEQTEELDLRDVEFRLSLSLQQISQSCKDLTKQQMNLIKFILCSGNIKILNFKFSQILTNSQGFYPNVAISDEFNQSHKESEQVYHTLFKNFVTIHPTSVYYGRSIFIQAVDLLCYEKVLETNKPYITNAFRTPALQTLLLCAQTSMIFRLLDFEH